MTVRRNTSTVASSPQKCTDNFAFPLLFQISSFICTGPPEYWSVRFSLKLIIYPATRPHSPFGLYVWVPYHFFSDPGPKKTSNDRARIFLHTLQLFWNSLNTSLRFLLSPYNVVVHYMKMILPVNCSGSHCISVIMFWISARICNIMNPGNLSTRPPSAPRRICEENVPRDGYGNTRLVPVRRDAMWDFASSLTWYSVGVVDGDRKVSMEAMVKLATSMHGEMRCRGFSSSLLGLVTARHTSRGAMAQYAEIHARRCDVGFLFVFIWVVDRKTDFETSCAAVLMPWIQGWRCRPAARCVDLLTDGMVDFVRV